MAVSLQKQGITMSNRKNAQKLREEQFGGKEAKGNELRLEERVESLEKVCESLLEAFASLEKENEELKREMGNQGKEESPQ